MWSLNNIVLHSFSVCNNVGMMHNSSDMAGELLSEPVCRG